MCGVQTEEGGHHASFVFQWTCECSDSGTFVYLRPVRVEIRELSSRIRALRIRNVPAFGADEHA